MKKRKLIRRSRAERFLSPFQEFIDRESSGGIVLLICALAALLWANSQWAEAYHSFWHNQFIVGYGDFALSKPLHLWINDGLMAIFFFVVGLEIKRELLTGELASLRKAILPVSAALGGMLAPAAIYALFNFGKESAAGWGIPMATDIAFALGIVALLGKGVPSALKIFLTALAIVDDLGAVLVIALFYTAEIGWLSLAAAALIYALLIFINWSGIRNPLVYALLGIGLWLAFLKSGVHATIAGVLLALTIPSHARINVREFAAYGRSILDDFENAGEENETVNDGQRAALQALEDAVEKVESPLQRLEHGLHPWVAFLIMPIFALANAGVALERDFFSLLVSPLSLGVVAGLVLGKQIGIMGFAWLAVRFKFADLPKGVTWRQIYGVSLLAGIGFTMSLFVADLAFGDTPRLDTAKVGILLASLISGVSGWLILRTPLGKK